MLMSCTTCGKPVSIRAESCPHCGETKFDWDLRDPAKLHVGQLSFEITDSDLATLFAPFGTVQHASVTIDKDTGRSKGFGYVEMGNGDEGRSAIAVLDGKVIDGHKLIVCVARGPSRPRGPSRR
jgi:cold-inducible RNA-binding protein